MKRRCRSTDAFAKEAAEAYVAHATGVRWLCLGCSMSDNPNLSLRCHDIVEPAMQQFARLLTDKGVVPVILKKAEHLDLRPIVSDISADAIAGGVLIDVDTSRLSPISGDFTYLAPINGIRQIAATGFNYKKHIEEFKMKPPAEPEVFLKAITSLTGPFDSISRGGDERVKLDWETELAIVLGREAR